MLALASKAGRWLVAHWYVPVAVLGALVGLLACRPRRPGEDPFQGVKDELAAVQAATEARNMATELGTAQALEHVKDKYQAKLAALESGQKAKAAELEADPAALAKYLEKLSR